MNEADRITVGAGTFNTLRKLVDVQEIAMARRRSCGCHLL